MSIHRSSSQWTLLMIVVSLIGLAVATLWGLSIRFGYLPQ